MKQGSILIVDDNRNILTTMKMLIESVLEHTAAIAKPESIPTRLREDEPDVVLLDTNFRSGIDSDDEGLFWLREIKELSLRTQVVLFTAHTDIELAVTGIKESATDFVVKPFDNAKLISILTNAYRKTKEDIQNATIHGGEMYWGVSPTMQDLCLIVERVAATDVNILIMGENGTGKEVLAKEIHHLSKRHGHQMMPIGMGAVTETLFESEFFGHTEGAFTDAKADKPGKFELAEGDTLFLDETGNLSYALQAKLLTALQYRSIVRVGGSEQIPIDARLIRATDRDLQEMVTNGEFREDLLYRINTIHLRLPPLRERKENITVLASISLKRYATMYNKPETKFSTDVMTKLEEQPWYGSIRELQYAMEKAVILYSGTVIAEDDIKSGPARREKPVKDVRTLDEMERRLTERTIRGCDGNLLQVAFRLGISRQTLYNKVKRYGL